MNRKIIQICVTSRDGVLALCDDGSTWVLWDIYDKGRDAWSRLVAIPQPEFVNAQYAQLLKPLDESDF